MSKEMSLIALGVWVIVVPYLGIPGSWRTALLVLTGLGIAAIGFLLRNESLSRGIESSDRHPFVESTPAAPAPAPVAAVPEHSGITSLN